MDEGKKLFHLLLYLHFNLYFNIVIFFSLSQNRQNVCGDCRCDRLKRRWCGSVRSCLPDTCPDWVCLSLWAVSTGCPWPVELEVGDRRELGEGWGECVWAGWQLSGLRGRVNTLPLTPSVVLSISSIQTQLCTCIHKHAMGDIRMPIQIPLKKNLHKYSHAHMLFPGQGRSSCYLNAILLLTGPLTHTLLCLIHRI